MEINHIYGCQDVYKPNYAVRKKQVIFGAANPIEDTFEWQKVEDTGFDFAKAIREAKERILQLICVDKLSNTKETEE